MKAVLVLSLSLLGAVAQAADAKWSNESEVSIVTIDGNSESETTSAKTKLKYAREKDSATLTASLTESEASSVTTAKSSNAGIRYDRVIDRKLSGYIGHGVFSDKFSGITQEDRSELGLSFQISKRDDQEWMAEIGYVHSEFDYAGVNLTPETESVDSLKLLTSYTKAINENVSAGAKIQYRDAFKNAEATNTPLYWVDAELNLAVVVSKILSLKLAYENKYQNYSANAPLQEKVDTKFTTALVAKF